MDKADEFLKQLDIRWPIIQAPMAAVSTPEMAAAVSNAGGLGSLSVGAMNAQEALATVARFRQLSTRSLNVNVFCHAPAVTDAILEEQWLKRLQPEFEKFGAHPPLALREIYKSFVDDDEMLAVLLDLKPKVLSFHFGLPGSVKIRRLREAGIILLATVTELKEAESAAAAGVHAIVAQGYEAGGHRGVFDPDAEDSCLNTAALLQVLVRHIELPVIAAGGIMDGQGIAAALRLGAVAAQLGTAFIATDESAADKAFRSALQSESAQHTLMTCVISGRVARCLPNRFTDWGRQIPTQLIPAYPIAYDAGKFLNVAAKAKGEYAYGAHWAGEGAPQARTMSSKDLMERLIEELST